MTNGLWSGTPGFWAGFYGFSEGGGLSPTPAPPTVGWILATGFWDDTGTWDDSAAWID